MDLPLTLPCPLCAHSMELRDTGNVRYSCPLQHEREYRCSCGYAEPAAPREGEGIKVVSGAEARALRPELYGKETA